MLTPEAEREILRAVEKALERHRHKRVKVQLNLHFDREGVLYGREQVLVTPVYPNVALHMVYPLKNGHP